ncbi:MAG: alpha/beta hydrolase [Paracoccaceae bacterium]
MSVPEYGNENGAPIVLVHGWSQSHQSWSRQLSGPLADEFRLVTPDLRGHGSSGKPEGRENYDTSISWAEDLHAVIDTLELHAPVLVGWSMGGWVVQDYIRHFGDAAIGGISLVGSSVASGTFTEPRALNSRTSDTAVTAEGMYSADLTTNIEATVDFLKACYASQLTSEELAFAVGFNMCCPPKIRKAARGRSENHKPELARVTCPAIVQWGAHDRIGADPMSRETADAIPGARLITYKNSGHAPFWDEAIKFNADLAAFANEVHP